jgi:hypothetical protein
LVHRIQQQLAPKAEVLHDVHLPEAQDRPWQLDGVRPGVCYVGALRLKGGGIVLIPLAMWLSRRHGERLSRSSIVRHIADSITGRDIAAAREYLEKIRRFGSDAD